MPISEDNLKTLLSELFNSNQVIQEAVAKEVEVLNDLFCDFNVPIYVEADTSNRIIFS